MSQAAKVKDEPLDLINVAIEELVRQRYELPAFGTLNKAARRVRASVNRIIERRIVQSLSRSQMKAIDGLFERDGDSASTPWTMLRQDPGKPSLKGLKAQLEKLGALSELCVGPDTLQQIPDVKLKVLAAEAATTTRCPKIQSLYLRSVHALSLEACTTSTWQRED